MITVNDPCKRSLVCLLKTYFNQKFTFPVCIIVGFHIVASIDTCCILILNSFVKNIDWLVYSFFVSRYKVNWQLPNELIVNRYWQHMIPFSRCSRYWICNNFTLIFTGRVVLHLFYSEHFLIKFRVISLNI